MVGIEDILNHSDESHESILSGAENSVKHSFSRHTKGRRSTNIPDGEGQTESDSWQRKIPRSKIDKKHLGNKRMVQISIRRKSAGRKTLLSETTPGISKLHFKYLEAGLRVKLTMVPSIFALYNSLMPHTNKRQIYTMVDGQSVPYDLSEDKEKENAYTITGRSMSSKPLQLIDNNLVNLSGYSNKVLLAFSHKKDPESNDLTHLPTFNSLDTAVSSLFGITEYTLVRVTRSTSSDHEGSVLLKLETAKPGDHSLIDDEEFSDEMLHSIGNSYDTPNNLFIKKIVARPRYKSDMKIFFIPYSHNASLYVDERMFERDLINDVINVDLHPTRKRVFCIFNFDHILTLYKNLLSLTKLEEETNINDAHIKEKSSKDDNDVGGSS